jgi:hypothetical protein
LRHRRLPIVVAAVFAATITAGPWSQNHAVAPAAASAGATGAAATCRSSATLLSDSPDGVVLRFETDSPPGGAGPPFGPQPVVAYAGSADARTTPWRAASSGSPAFSVLVRVPDLGPINAEVVDAAFRPVAARDRETASDPAARARDLVDVSEPAIIRGTRVVRVTISPFARWSDEGLMAASLTVRLAAASGPGVNERTHRLPPPAPAFGRILARLVINGPPDGGFVAGSRKRGGSREGAEYLVIVPDEFEDAVAPLVQWKELKGVTCRVATLSETGPTTQAIMSFISDAYFEWDVPPEYVLLAGDSELIPVHEGLTPTDNFYAAVDGADYLADVLIGRMPAETVEQCAYLVAKAVAYERADVPVAAHWPASGALFLHEDGDNSDHVYYENTESVRALMDSAGFAPIDTLFAGPTGAGVSQAEVAAVMNEGRGFVNYRGSAYAVWPAPFALYPPNLTNGWNQPVVVSATCATVGYAADHYLSHSLTRAGSIDDPKGASAFVGTTTSGFGLDLKRGYFDVGFFEDAFGDGRTIGEALAAGKLKLFTLDEDRKEYEGWSIMGDPELNLWTRARQQLSVSHDDRIQAGPCDLVVRVSADGRPVEGARATCTFAPDVAVSALTGAAGRAVLSFETSSAGTLDVVVTARNAIPYRGRVEIVDTGPFLAPWSLAVGDIGGNGDGLVSPGERASLELFLMNSGDEAAGDVTATLRSADPHVSILDSVAVYGSVPVGATAGPDRAYTIDVDAERRRDTPIELAVLIEYGEWTRLSYIPPVDVAAGRLILEASAFDDRAPGGNGDGLADPGETGALRLELLNVGECGLTSIEAALASADAAVAVLAGDARYADAPAGSLVANAAEPFIVSIAPGAPTSETASLTLTLSSQGHSYDCAETLDVYLTIEEDPATLATGPDAYGYYAYDSADTQYLEHPSYDWVDIAPPGPGDYIRYVSTGDDRMKLETLPFPFTYYGTAESYISIGSNGVIAFGAADYVFGDNSPIPNLHGPASMVAPFWDDLDPSLGGDVYAWHDQQGHRYVIQYEGVLRAGTGAPETFEVILLDPAHHPTASGDGAIIFQYESVLEAAECTIGIENQQQDDGIEYAFDGTYDGHASEVAGGLAILFTTDPPASPAAPWLVLRSAAVEDSAQGNGDGVAEPGETVSLVFGLANLGTADATDLSLVLTGEDSTVIVVDGAAAVEDIPAGGAGTNADDPFSVAVSASAVEGRAALWVTLGGPAGHSQSALRYDLVVGSPAVAVRSLALAPCHPNPFGSGTAMRIDLPDGGRELHRVLVRVYNVAGRLVATAFDGELPAGSHEIAWDGNGADGERAASGVYFIRADAAGATRTRKAVLLR